MDYKETILQLHLIASRAQNAGVQESGSATVTVYANDLQAFINAIAFLEQNVDPKVS